MNWIKIGDSKLFKFENVNDSIEGKLMNIRTGGKFDSKMYDVETDSGMLTFFGSTVIDGRLTKDLIGSRIKVVYTGKATTETGTEYKTFDVFYSVIDSSEHKE